MHYCSFSNIFFQPLTDAAEVLFKRCITPVEKTLEITYNYELLEHYSTEKHKTANAQNSAQTATNAQTSGSVATNAQTSCSVAQTSGSAAQTSGSVAQTSGSAAQTSGSVTQTSGSAAQTSGSAAQSSGSTATNATTQTVATSSFITPGATNPLAVSVSTPTPQTTCPSWLSHMDQRKLEKKDDIPNHPLVLMVNMQAVPHNNIVSLVSLSQCHVTFPVYTYSNSISMCLYHGSVPCT